MTNENLLLIGIIIIIIIYFYYQHQQKPLPKGKQPLKFANQNTQTNFDLNKSAQTFDSYLFNQRRSQWWIDYPQEKEFATQTFPEKGKVAEQVDEEYENLSKSINQFLDDLDEDESEDKNPKTNK